MCQQQNETIDASLITQVMRLMCDIVHAICVLRLVLQLGVWLRCRDQMRNDPNNPETEPEPEPYETETELKFTKKNQNAFRTDHLYKR